MFLSMVKSKYRILASDITLRLYDWDIKKPITDKEIGSAFTIRAFNDKKELGHAQVYKESKWYVYEVHVDDSSRRQGIATKMYDYAEELVGGSVYPQVLDSYIDDPQISIDAFLFWKKRSPDLVEDILESVIDENREELSKL